MGTIIQKLASQTFQEVNLLLEVKLNFGLKIRVQVHLILPKPLCALRTF